MALGATQPTSLLKSGDKEAPSLVFNCLLARSFTILALDAVLCQLDKVLKYRVSKKCDFQNVASPVNYLSNHYFSHCFSH